MKMKSMFLKILLLAMIITSVTHAGTQFVEVEQALKIRDYNKANSEFENLKKKYKSNKIKLLQKFSINFVKLLESTNEYIDQCKNYDCEQVDLNMFNTEYASFKMYAGYYTKAFQKDIFKSYKSTFQKANNLNNLIVENQNNKALEQHNKWKKDRELKKKQQKEFIAKAKQKDKEIDLKVKKMGYKGFTGMGITSLIYNTQQNGNLATYINSVVGCSELRKQDCNDLNSNLKVSQILDDSVIYRYFEMVDGKLLEYSIIVPKEANKLYQINERFDNGFYVFTGMFNYTSVIGVNMSIPKLKKIYIK